MGLTTSLRKSGFIPALQQLGNFIEKQNVVAEAEDKKNRVMQTGQNITELFQNLGDNPSIEQINNATKASYAMAFKNDAMESLSILEPMAKIASMNSQANQDRIAKTAILEQYGNTLPKNLQGANLDTLLKVTKSISDNTKSMVIKNADGTSSSHQVNIATGAVSKNGVVVDADTFSAETARKRSEVVYESGVNANRQMQVNDHAEANREKAMKPFGKASDGTPVFMSKTGGLSVYNQKYGVQEPFQGDPATITAYQEKSKSGDTTEKILENDTISKFDSNSETIVTTTPDLKSEFDKSAIGKDASGLYKRPTGQDYSNFLRLYSKEGKLSEYLPKNQHAKWYNENKNIENIYNKKQTRGTNTPKTEKTISIKLK